MVKKIMLGNGKWVRGQAGWMLLICLGVMAMSLPAAIKLIGQNQDTRDQAAETPPEFILSTRSNLILKEFGIVDKKRSLLDCGISRMNDGCFCLWDKQCRSEICQNWKCSIK